MECPPMTEVSVSSSSFNDMSKNDSSGHNSRKRRHQAFLSDSSTLFVSSLNQPPSSDSTACSTPNTCKLSAHQPQYIQRISLEEVNSQATIYISSFCIRQLLKTHTSRLYYDSVLNESQFLYDLSQYLPDYLPFNDETYFYEIYFPHMMNRLHHSYHSSPSCRIVAIIYLQRLLCHCPSLIVPLKIIPILYGVILTIATKFVDDSLHSNTHYAACLGVHLSVFNSLERRLLNCLFYHLSVNASMIEPLQRMLCV